MPSRGESARARERRQSATPICDGESLQKLNEEVAEYMREARRRDALGPDERPAAALMIPVRRATPWPASGRACQSPR